MTPARSDRARDTDVAAAPLALPVWRAARLWVLLVTLIGLGAIAITVSSAGSGAALDPNSAAHGGSKALRVLLGNRGTHVRAISALADASSAPAPTTVLVAFPNDLAPAQLAQLAESGHRLILIDPDPASLSAVAPDRHTTKDTITDPAAPGCSQPGPQAAGPVAFPDPVSLFTGDSSCYGGAVVITDQLVLLGAAGLLRNDQLAQNNIAALDINAISADGSVTEVDWLLPGPDDTGAGRPSVWDLFPAWTQHAFWWLLVVGVLTALWKGRRLGPVVEEPLPVIVRSAEIVEGHGRLYRRAHARERAAALLRAATVVRLAARLGLDRRVPSVEVVAVVSATESATRGQEIAALLTGAAPADDRALLELARGLAALEATERTGLTRSAEPGTRSSAPTRSRSVDAGPKGTLE